MSNKDLVAILGQEGNHVWVWTIFVGANSSFGFSRLTGAWQVSPAGLKGLHFWPQVVGVICTNKLWGELKCEFGEDIRRIDADEIVTSIEDDLAKLQQMYVGAQAKLKLEKKNAKLVAPRWPKLIKLPVSNLRSAEGKASMDDVLEAAWWLKSICDRWAEIEEIRLTRIYMREEVGFEVRNQPWMSASVRTTLI